MLGFDENVRDAKSSLRQEYLALRASIPTDKKEALDKKICALTTSLASFRFADTVLIYSPIGSELNVMPIAEKAWAMGKRVAFPRSNAALKTMDFKYVGSADELIEGEYSIPEPAEDAESVKDFSRSICIVPGLIFDREGYRIGYGKGFYDRFFNSYNETKIGLAYYGFILDYVPRGRFDKHVDILVSEKGVSLAEPPKTK